MDIGTVYTAKIHARDLLARPNIVGLGIGYKQVQGEETDKLSVITMVAEKRPVAALAPGELIPPQIKSVPTDVVEVGILRPLQSRRDRWRPAPGGVSIGHYKISAGTLGIAVTEKVTNVRLILSNNHVLANSNNATLGDPIYQPGPADGGRPEDTIGSLYNFVPLDFGEDDGDCIFAEYYQRFGNFLAGIFNSRHVLNVRRIDPQAVNYVDAAVAIPNQQTDIIDNILDVGTITDYENASLGMLIGKSGRTTALTTGRVTMVHATVQVQYGGGKVATFEEQILSDHMSQGGDSGSLMYSYEDKKAVGLLFAGSNRVTIYSPIQRVLDALNIMI